MARKNFNAYIKRQKEGLKRKKKLEKQKDKENRKHTDGTLDNMIAYVDENGNIVDELPDKDLEEGSDESN